MESSLAVLERRARRRSLVRKQRARRRLTAAVVVTAALAFSVWSLARLAAQLQLAILKSSALVSEPGRVVPRSAAQPMLCPAPVTARPILAQAVAATGLPSGLLVSLAKIESRFDPHAVSKAGARGMFQLMPQTAAALRIDPGDPRANAVGGAKYLRQLLSRFGRLDLALAAYNAGPTAVTRSGGAPTIAVLRYALTIEREAVKLSGCSLGPVDRA